MLFGVLSAALRTSSQAPSASTSGHRGSGSAACRHVRCRLAPTPDRRARRGRDRTPGTSRRRRTGGSPTHVVARTPSGVRSYRPDEARLRSGHWPRSPTTARTRTWEAQGNRRHPSDSAMRCASVRQWPPTIGAERESNPELARPPDLPARQGSGAARSRAVAGHRLAADPGQPRRAAAPTPRNQCRSTKARFAGRERVLTPGDGGRWYRAAPGAAAAGAARKGGSAAVVPGGSGGCTLYLNLQRNSGQWAGCLLARVVGRFGVQSSCKGAGLHLRQQDGRGPLCIAQ